MANSKRRCKGCSRYLRQDKHDWRKSPIGWFHTHACQSKFAIKLMNDKRKAVKRAKAVAYKKRVDEVKGLPHWNNVTQKDVNRYVRLRDADLQCISCPCWPHQSYTTSLTGGAWDAGHYKTVGARPQLRFNVRNINKQCRKCNSFEGGNISGQKEGIVARFGQERLDWLDSHHEPKVYTFEQLKRIRRIANKRAKRYLNA